MDDLRVGRRYAQALFSTALAHDMVTSVEEDFQSLTGLIDNDAQFQRFLFAPYTSRDQKKEIIERIFSDRITALTMETLRLMLEKGREAEIGNVYREFVVLRRANEGIVHVVVTSAEQLDNGQRNALVAKVGSVLGKKIEADYEVDPLLIGGLRVAYEGNVMNGTVRGTLNGLRERLKYDLLKRIS